MAGAGGLSNGGTATIIASKVTGNSAPADSAGDQGIGGAIANINLGSVTGTFDGGVLTITFSQVSRNTASGQGGGILAATITSSGPAMGGPLTIKFSQITRNKAASGGGIFAVPGSLVTLKVTVVAENTPNNCAPAGAIAGCKN